MFVDHSFFYGLDESMPNSCHTPHVSAVFTATLHNVVQGLFCHSVSLKKGVYRRGSDVHAYPVFSWGVASVCLLGDEECSAQDTFGVFFFSNPN